MQWICVTAEEHWAWGTHYLIASEKQACSLSQKETLMCPSRSFVANTALCYGLCKSSQGLCILRYPARWLGAWEIRGWLSLPTQVVYFLLIERYFIELQFFFFKLEWVHLLLNTEATADHIKLLWRSIRANTFEQNMYCFDFLNKCHSSLRLFPVYGGLWKQIVMFNKNCLYVACSVCARYLKSWKRMSGYNAVNFLALGEVLCV